MLVQPVQANECSTWAFIIHLSIRNVASKKRLIKVSYYITWSTPTFLFTSRDLLFGAFSFFWLFWGICAKTLKLFLFLFSDNVTLFQAANSVHTEAQSTLLKLGQSSFQQNNNQRSHVVSCGTRHRTHWIHQYGFIVYFFAGFSSIAAHFMDGLKPFSKGREHTEWGIWGLSAARLRMPVPQCVADIEMKCPGNTVAKKKQKTKKPTIS